MILAVLLVMLAHPLAGEETPVIHFSWALICQDGNGSRQAIDYNRSVLAMHSGYRFKFYLRAASPCFFYLYLFDSQQNLFLLFPGGDELGEREQGTDARYTLPGIDTWYYLDENRGVETLYLIASRLRLRDLEARTRRYLQQTDRSNRFASMDAKYDVLDTIKSMINESSHLAGAVEKPLAVAGDFRGINQEDQIKGVGVTTGGVYVKTIRLRH